MENKQVCIALASAIDQFINDVNALLEHHELANTPDHLNKVADELFTLNDKSLEILKSHDEEVEDIGAIIQDIITQPINGRGKKEPTTMLKSAEEHKAAPSEDSTLHVVLANCVRYSHATQSLIKELDLLSDELKKYAA